MINVIPDWLQDAIDFLNQEFKEDEDVNVTILYGFDCVGTDEGIGGFAVYNTEAKTIMLADYNELKRVFDGLSHTDVGELSWQDVKDTTIMNLFHEYRHHQQNTYGWEISEDDAEHFAEHLYKEFVSWAH